MILLEISLQRTCNFLRDEKPERLKRSPSCQPSQAFFSLNPYPQQTHAPAISSSGMPVSLAN